MKNVLDKNEKVSDNAYTLLNLMQQTLDEGLFFKGLLKLIRNDLISMQIIECAIEIFHIFIKDSVKFCRNRNNVADTFSVVVSLLNKDL